MDWDDRYATFGKTFGEEPTPFLKEAFRVHGMVNKKDGPLELVLPGDGYGRNGIWLASMGHRVQAFDYSKVAIEMANEASKYVTGGEYLTALLDPTKSLSGLMGNPVDGVLNIWFRLEDISDRMRVNSVLFDRIRKGGFILVVSSLRVTSYIKEKNEWPKHISWLNYSNDSEVRMIGWRL